MGWLPVGLGVFAAWLLRGTGHNWLFWIAVIAAVGSFWSFGIMHNYAVESAKKRNGFTGGFCDITPHDVDAAPDLIARLNLLCAIVTVALVIVGAVVRILR